MTVYPTLGDCTQRALFSAAVGVPLGPQHPATCLFDSHFTVEETGSQKLNSSSDPELPSRSPFSALVVCHGDPGSPGR